MGEGYSVTVSRFGEDILTIEHDCLSGLSNLSNDDIRGIFDAGQHLVGFAGDPDEKLQCFLCGETEQCKAGCPPQVGKT